MGVIVNQGLPKGVGGRGRRSSTGCRRRCGRISRSALQPAFLAAAVLCVVVLVIVLFGIREVPLRKGFEEPSLADELGEGGRR